ncbi:MAG: HDIG domain-containing protein [Leptolyngbyaceae cyanobacterium SL_7_1]|nr:HDIG domain-containing protein [Leptolyngbyaceae cyanobacterium SL_7_1]
MKSLRLLKQQVGHWWLWLPRGIRRHVYFVWKHLSTWRDTYLTAESLQGWQRWLEQGFNQRLTVIPHSRSLKRKSNSRGVLHPLGILLIAVISLTSTIGYHFYNEPQLRVEAIAPQTLRAPYSTVVEDSETTEKSRKEARVGAIPVLMIDASIDQEIDQALQRLLVQGDELRYQIGAFPFLDSSLLSVNTQKVLRQSSDKLWQAILEAVEQPYSPSSTPLNPPGQPNKPLNFDRLNPSEQVAILELQIYRRTHSLEDFEALKQLVTRIRQRYVLVSRSLASSADGLTPLYDDSLFTLTDAEWLTTKAAIDDALNRILTQGIPPGLPEEILQDAIQVQLQQQVPSSALPLATKLLTTVTKPNLVQDAEQTRLRAEQAAQNVEPVMVDIRQDEVIVSQGEMITQSDFVLLDYFGLSRRGINWVGLIGLGTWITGAVIIFLLVERQLHSGFRRRDYILVLLLALSTPPLVAIGFSATSLPLIGLLIGSFYGSALGVTVVGLLGLTVPLAMDISSNHLIATLISSLVGAGMAGRLRSREELALLGGVVGLVQGVMYLLLSLSLSAANPVWYSIFTVSALQGLIGIAWSVVALGISPYLEHVFDLVTPIRLAELSNPNRPLLKRLASEAPGTFQHTLFVASLAEAAARSLRCNVELVRAGTLYHDIGKMHDAMAFIENQMGGANKHDAIDEPWLSAAIIKKHVSEGLVMARKYRLPKAIQAFIPEHQGTMLIAYFYHEAQKRSQLHPSLVVRESDFRYDGPIPQSRETAIVMLADSCEAALRSLKDATPEEALALINRIMRARWQDGQLTDSGLSRLELGKIAEIFVCVWQQFNHQRIAYPKLAPTSSPAS